MKKEYTLTVNADQIAMIGAGLGQLPHDRVRGLIDALQVQINEQNKEEESDAK